MKRSAWMWLSVAASVVIVLVVGLFLTRSRPGSDRLPAPSPSSREGPAANTLEQRPSETSPAEGGQPIDAPGGSPASSEPGVGVPVYTKASKVVLRSGQGDGARWYEVSFVTFDPFDQVVKFYQGHAGRRATTYLSTSAKVKSALIAIAPTFQDQTTVNISRDVGSPETKVVILRNLLILPNQPARTKGREGVGGGSPPAGGPGGRE